MIWISENHTFKIPLEPVGRLVEKRLSNDVRINENHTVKIPLESVGRHEKRFANDSTHGRS